MIMNQVERFQRSVKIYLNRANESSQFISESMLDEIR